jgi:hypothetical protein
VRADMFVVAYFSPETLLPATSIIATIVGIVMMLGRGGLRLVVRASGRGLRKPGRVAATSKPHLHVHDDVSARAQGR